MENASTRKKYKEAGSCLWCPSPRHYSEQRKRHLKLCTKHNEAERANKKRRLDRLRSEGKCHNCGQLTGTAYSRCNDCRDKDKARLKDIKAS